MGCAPKHIPQENGLSSKVSFVNELLSKGEYARAYPLLIDMENHYPVKKDRVLYDRGICLMQEKRYVEAIDAFTLAIQENPMLFEAYLNRAYCYEMMQDRRRALEDLRHCLSWKGHLYLVRYNIGNLLMHSREYIKAVEEFKKAIKERPEFVPALNNLSICYMKLGDLSMASRYLKRAIALSGEDGDLYFNLGIVMEMRDRYRDAIDAYSKALEIAPQYGAAYNNRGLLYLYLNKKTQACRDLKDACECGLCDNYNRLKEIEVCE